MVHKCERSVSVMRPHRFDERLDVKRLLERGNGPITVDTSSASLLADTTTTGTSSQRSSARSSSTNSAPFIPGNIRSSRMRPGMFGSIASADSASRAVRTLTGMKPSSIRMFSSALAMASSSSMTSTRLNVTFVVSRSCSCMSTSSVHMNDESKSRRRRVSTRVGNACSFVDGRKNLRCRSRRDRGRRGSRFRRSASTRSSAAPSACSPVHR
jgi:hypothetical protein